MVIISILIPSYQGKSLESPFVVIFQNMGIPYAGDIMNLVIITALLSAANSGLYAASRMVWSLSNEGMFLNILKTKQTPNADTRDYF